MPVFRCQAKYERDLHLLGYTRVAGVDEVGRGCLFGAVFAAAVILSPERPLRGLRDSKALVPERRNVLADRIREKASAWAVAAADVFEIDSLNILQASRLAMKRALEKLSPPPDYVLVDAVSVDMAIPQRAIIHGDALCQCIAAASILAKVERDACMLRWHEVFPEYGLDQNKGYCTPDHIDAIKRFGPTMLHRFSFEPVREHCRFQFWSGYPEQQEFQFSEQAAGEA
jgi:ribonuclease HII